MKTGSGSSLKKAVGENSNPFYQTPITAKPVISDKAVIAAPQLKATFVYDIPTKAGAVYSLIIQ